MPKLPMDAAEMFDRQIPAGLAQNADNAREINAIYVFKIGGEGGGEWTCDLTANPPTCVRGDQGNAHCTVVVDHVDFIQMLSDPQAGMHLYFQGKLRVEGDPMLGMKLQELFKFAES